MKKNKGFSLIETLIVVAIFAVLAIVSTQAIIVTLTNSRKAESSVQTRESLQYIVSVLERSLRNANNVISASSDRIIYTDENNASSVFQCVDATANSNTGRLLLNSSQVSSQDITITNCNFSMVAGTSDMSDRVMVSISGKAKNLTGTEQTPITISTIVYLRVY